MADTEHTTDFVRPLGVPTLDEQIEKIIADTDAKITRALGTRDRSALTRSIMRRLGADAMAREGREGVNYAA